MVRAEASSLYEEVVDITHAYFGPAARRFVNRQIDHHLDKDPLQLCKSDLAKLVDWMGVAMALLAEDQELVNRYVAELRLLAGD